jgi:outer membrane lipoprotein-sorting protein
MKKRKFLFIIVTLLSVAVYAQNSNKATSILDKTASIIGRRGGASASFSISGGKIGSQSGTIHIKGNKFYARTSNSIIWFDGKTQWTYMKSSGEVNISKPTQAQQQAMNPYAFINLYKTGFNATMKNVSNGYQIHLVAQNKKRTLKELYLVIGKNYQLKEVRMSQGGSWTKIKISSFRATNQSDAIFRFNAKEFPKAEIIDLR